MAALLLRQQWIVFDHSVRLQAEGIVTRGTKHGVRLNKTDSIALVEFTVKGEDARIRELPVSRQFATELNREGGRRRVNVRYLPDDPDVAGVVGASQPSGWGRLHDRAVRCGRVGISQGAA